MYIKLSTPNTLYKLHTHAYTFSIYVFSSNNIIIAWSFVEKKQVLTPLYRRYRKKINSYDIIHSSISSYFMYHGHITTTYCILYHIVNSIEDVIKRMCIMSRILLEK